MAPPKRIWRRTVQRIVACGFNRRSAVHRLSETVQHPAEQARTHGQPGVLGSRNHFAAQLQTIRFIEGHGQHAAVPESDHLRADPAVVVRQNVAKIADRRGGTRRFNKKTHGRGDLSAPRQQIDLIQISNVSLERNGLVRFHNCGAHL